MKIWREVQVEITGALDNPALMHFFRRQATKAIRADIQVQGARVYSYCLDICQIPEVDERGRLIRVKDMLSANYAGEVEGNPMGLKREMK